MSYLLDAMASGATPEETAAAIAADPAWRFAEDPIAAVRHCSVSAADAYNGTVAPYLRDRAQAAYVTEVGLRLVALADNPHIRVGAVLSGLAETLGVSVG